MRPFPEAPKKSLIPSFAAYPIGYELLRSYLEPHLPPEQFELGFHGIDQRLAKSRDFSPVVVFRLQYSPSKWRDSYWSLYAHGALRKDKAAIREAMIEFGFESLVEFLTRKREPIWKDLAFSRSLIWNSTNQSLSSEDYSKLEGKRPNQPPEPTAMSVTPRADARVAPATTVAHL